MERNEEGMNHLLLTDETNLLLSIQHDFPDIAKVFSIGKSYEGRDINVLEIDAGKPSSKPELELNVQFPADLTGVQSTADLTTVSKVPDDIFSKDTQAWDSGTAEMDHNKTMAEAKPDPPTEKPAILVTGATHARELISTSLVNYEMLQLLQEGAVKKDGVWPTLLAENKYYYMPMFNVDGVANIEKHWVANHKMIEDRKNRDARYSLCPTSELQGVDLNRNFGVDFG